VIETAVFSLYTGARGFRMTRADASLWWLSVSLAHRHFPRVELMADARGAVLLRRLGIRFDRIRLGFREIPNHARELPTQAKLFALRDLAREGTSAISVDHDVLLDAPLPTELLRAECVLQSPFPLGPHYLALAKTLFLPPQWRAPEAAYNAGLLGSDNPRRLLSWAEAAIGVLHHPANARHLRNGDNFTFRSLVEETSHAGYFDSVTPLYFDRPPIGYAHFAGDAKRRPENFERIAARIESEHPEAWALIEALTSAGG
jgi:hypothetical protein